MIDKYESVTMFAHIVVTQQRTLALMRIAHMLTKTAEDVERLIAAAADPQLAFAYGNQRIDTAIKRLTMELPPWAIDTKGELPESES